MQRVHAPIIGIATGIDGDRARVRREYAECVRRAGAVPVLLAPPTDRFDEAAAEQLSLCHALVLTGGDDPATERYGEPTHAAATLEHPHRQAFDEALIREATARDTPTLGVCLGMQMMALLAGGALNQHLPDDTPTHTDHAHNRTHEVRPTVSPEAMPHGWVASSHHQAVRDPGDMRVVAAAHDGVIEAIDDPARRFWLGVQWHPERTEFEPLGLELFRRLVNAARSVRVP